MGITTGLLATDRALGAPRDLFGPAPIDLLRRQRTLRFIEAAKQLGRDIRALVDGQAKSLLQDLACLTAHIRSVPLRGCCYVDLGKIVDEYAADAISALDASATCFTSGDRRWVLDRATRTLPEIEAATLRLVALRQAGSVNGAAARRGMSHTALSQWLGRRMFGRGKR